jgi:hypothetical protein
MKSNEQLRAENDAIRGVLAGGPEERLRGIPGVVHVSVGLKEQQGRLLTDRLCIRVYVSKKKSPRELSAAELIPAEIAGIPTDVNTVARFEFQADNARYRPIKGGIEITNGNVVPFGTTAIAGASAGQSLPLATVEVTSTASFPAVGTFTVTTTGVGGGTRSVAYTGKDPTHFTGCDGGVGTLGNGAAVAGSPLISRGTLGCVAVDDTDQSAVLLSNWHVLEGSTGSDGDNVFQPAPERLAIVPPGLPNVRPTDDADKIAVIRRSVISDKVDAAIARIDVSSCCHCCGVHYSNEINGLSVGGRPPRNTIVGDDHAVAGMTVFKVGASTLRTEGLVVDADYPSFPIQYGGAGYVFTGQIAIQNIDHAKQFSDMGDSGAAVISLNNNIVGLVFAAGKDVAAGGAPQPFITLANHISDVFTALQIHIAYSPDVVVTAGRTLAGFLPDTDEVAIPEPYHVLRERLKRHDRTAPLLALGQRHRDEIMHLINHCRPVTVAWHRCQGPALLATLMSAVRDGHYRVPAAVKGVALHEALQRMRAVLRQHGSADLKESLGRPDADAVIEAYRDCTDLNEAIERLAAGRMASPASVAP